MGTNLKIAKFSSRQDGRGSTIRPRIYDTATPNPLVNQGARVQLLSKARNRVNSSGTLPNLIIIGAMKCATTSLHYYLNLHPQVSMVGRKELNFFISERNWGKGLSWYGSNFISTADVRGETSPAYANYPRFSGVPERMYSVVPEAKVIYLVRDPIDRIISHYIHNFVIGLEKRSVENALKDFDNCTYTRQSRYYMQLEQYLKYYPPSNILIITREDLYRYRERTLKEVFRFLGVDEAFFSKDFARLRNQSKYKRHQNKLGSHLAKIFESRVNHLMPRKVRGYAKQMIYLPFSKKMERPRLGDSLRQNLIAYLREDTYRLREYVGRDFGQWCM
jgi:hypothetical protein